MVPFLHRMAPSTMEENPLWLVVLCDMMTNLMLFFMMLYGYTEYAKTLIKPVEKGTYSTESLIEKPGGESPLGFPEFEASPEVADLKAALSKEGFEGDFDLVATERDIRLRLKERLLFELGQAGLSAEAGRTLDPLARILAQMPNPVIIEGHTDSAPIVGGPYRTNWELSVARSYSLIAGLVERGIPPARLIASGYGDIHPVDRNDTPQGRLRNRRVEVVLQRSDEDY